jgi:hypothetical protein
MLDGDPAQRSPDPADRPEAPDAERRAIVRALGSSPVILTLLAGRAHAEYRDGVYVPYVPDDDECDPEKPNHPPGQDPQPGCGSDH